MPLFASGYNNCACPSGQRPAPMRGLQVCSGPVLLVLQIPVWRNDETFTDVALALGGLVS